MQCLYRDSIRSWSSHAPCRRVRCSKVIAAVFINETNRVTASDEEIALIKNRPQPQMTDMLAKVACLPWNRVRRAEVGVLRTPDCYAAHAATVHLGAVHRDWQRGSSHTHIPKWSLVWAHVHTLRKMSSKHLNKLRDRFSELDTTGDGYIEWHEVLQTVELSILLLCLSSMLINMQSASCLPCDARTHTPLSPSLSLSLSLGLC